MKRSQSSSASPTTRMPGLSGRALFAEPAAGDSRPGSVKGCHQPPARDSAAALAPSLMANVDYGSYYSTHEIGLPDDSWEAVLPGSGGQALSLRPSGL